MDSEKDIHPELMKVASDMLIEQKRTGKSFNQLIADKAKQANYNDKQIDRLISRTNKAYLHATDNQGFEDIIATPHGVSAFMGNAAFNNTKTAYLFPEFKNNYQAPEPKPFSKEANLIPNPMGLKKQLSDVLNVDFEATRSKYASCNIKISRLNDSIKSNITLLKQANFSLEELQTEMKLSEDGQKYLDAFYQEIKDFPMSTNYKQANMGYCKNVIQNCAAQIEDFRETVPVYDELKSDYLKLNNARNDLFTFRGT